MDGAGFMHARWMGVYLHCMGFSSEELLVGVDVHCSNGWVVVYVGDWGFFCSFWGFLFFQFMLHRC